MEFLSQHIEYLLLRKECVILPGVGAFIATYRNAIIDRENGIIAPPQWEISFNRAVTADDGTLAHSIARSRKCSFEEARRIVISAVSAFLEKLSLEKRLAIGNIGSLHMDSDNHISFTPRYSVDRYAQLMGEQRVKYAKEDDKSFSVDNSPEASEESNRYYIIKISKRVTKVAAVLIATVGICLGFLIPQERPTPEVTMAAIVPIESGNANKSSEVSVETKEMDEPLEANYIQEPSFAEEPADVSKEDNLKYYLIIGTFATKNGAEQFIAHHSGEALEICGSRTGIWRVSAANSADRNELQKKMNERGFLDKHPGSWIWERK